MASSWPSFTHPPDDGVLATFVEGDAAVGEEHRVRHLHEVLAAGVLLGLPLHVEGADRGRVVLVAGHDVHRAAGDAAVVEQPGPAARRCRRTPWPSPCTACPGRARTFARVAVVPRGSPSRRRGGGRPSWPIRRDPPAGAGAAAGAAGGCGGPAARGRGNRAAAGDGRRGSRGGPGHGQVGGERRAGAGQRACRAARPDERHRADDDERRRHAAAPSTAARARPCFPRRARDRA